MPFISSSAYQHVKMSLRQSPRPGMSQNRPGDVRNANMRNSLRPVFPTARPALPERGRGLHAHGETSRRRADDVTRGALLYDKWYAALRPGLFPKASHAALERANHQHPLRPGYLALRGMSRLGLQRARMAGQAGSGSHPDRASRGVWHRQADRVAVLEGPPPTRRTISPAYLDEAQHEAAWRSLLQ